MTAPRRGAHHRRLLGAQRVPGRLGLARDYDEWGDGWTFSELEPSSTGRSRCSVPAPTATASSRRSIARSSRPAARRPAPARRRQRPRRHRRHRPGPVNARGAVRWNTAFAYLDDARSRANLTVLPETLVDRVTFDRGRADGVASDRGRLTADVVILAAGAYGSPAVLLRVADRATTSSSSSGSMSSPTFRSGAA